MIVWYNDTPMKEFVEGRILVVSTDFSQMGLRAAEYVLDRQEANLNVKEFVSTSLIIRNSL